VDAQCYVPWYERSGRRGTVWRCNLGWRTQRVHLFETGGLYGMART